MAPEYVNIIKIVFKRLINIWEKNQKVSASSALLKINVISLVLEYLKV